MWDQMGTVLSNLVSSQATVLGEQFQASLGTVMEGQSAQLAQVMQGLGEQQQATLSQITAMFQILDLQNRPAAAPAGKPAAEAKALAAEATAPAAEAPTPAASASGSNNAWGSSCSWSRGASWDSPWPPAQHGPEAKWGQRAASAVTWTAQPQTPEQDWGPLWPDDPPGIAQPAAEAPGEAAAEPPAAGDAAAGGTAAEPPAAAAEPGAADVAAPEWTAPAADSPPPADVPASDPTWPQSHFSPRFLARHRNITTAEAVEHLWGPEAVLVPQHVVLPLAANAAPATLASLPRPIIPPPGNHVRPGAKPAPPVQPDVWRWAEINVNGVWVRPPPPLLPPMAVPPLGPPPTDEVRPLYVNTNTAPRFQPSGEKDGFSSCVNTAFC